MFQFILITTVYSKSELNQQNSTHRFNIQIMLHQRKYDKGAVYLLDVNSGVITQNIDSFLSS